MTDPDKQTFEEQITELVQFLSWRHMQPSLDHLFSKQGAIDVAFTSRAHLHDSLATCAISGRATGSELSDTDVELLVVPCKCVIDPVRSTSSILLGIVIIGLKIPGGEDQKSSEHTLTGRIAMDPHTNESIMLYNEFGRADATVVVYSKPEKTTMLRVLTCYVSRDRFETGIRTAARALVANAVEMCTVHLASGPCRSGSDDNGSQYDGKLLSHSPAFEFDFEALRHLFPYRGRWTGRIEIMVNEKSRNAPIRRLQRLFGGVGPWGATIPDGKCLWGYAISAYMSELSVPSKRALLAAAMRGFEKKYGIHQCTAWSTGVPLTGARSRPILPRSSFSSSVEAQQPGVPVVSQGRTGAASGEDHSTDADPGRRPASASAGILPSGDGEISKHETRPLHWMDPHLHTSARKRQRGPSPNHPDGPAHGRSPPPSGTADQSAQREEERERDTEENPGRASAATEDESSSAPRADQDS